MAPSVGSLSPGRLSVMVTLKLVTLSVNVRINVAWAEVAHNANAPAASVVVTSFLMVIFMSLLLKMATRSIVESKLLQLVELSEQILRHKIKTSNKQYVMWIYELASGCAVHNV